MKKVDIIDKHQAKVSYLRTELMRELEEAKSAVKLCDCQDFAKKSYLIGKDISSIQGIASEMYHRGEHVALSHEYDTIAATAESDFEKILQEFEKKGRCKK
jgi:hypothetical protein